MFFLKKKSKKKRKLDEYDMIESSPHQNKTHKKQKISNDQNHKKTKEKEPEEIQEDIYEPTLQFDFAAVPDTLVTTTNHISLSTNGNGKVNVDGVTKMLSLIHI
eukprot:TRINITY_DN13588_c0_g1_i1.p1 TRINITY_DN13588_c0_g1~~TRINITY_DN13588_c0_g1_i1.p1  ORF type:complete len:104 (-),score=33.23 TRINITY_DN13588_c0_g1_i1:26-337(-)